MSRLSLDVPHRQKSCVGRLMGTVVEKVTNAAYDRLLKEQFWCPSHGRMANHVGRVIMFDENGTLHLPYYKAFCRICGKFGSFVCRGTLDDCNIKSGYCLSHLCHTGPNPYPGDIVERLQKLGVERRDKECTNWELF